MRPGRAYGTSTRVFTYRASMISRSTLAALVPGCAVLCLYGSFATLAILSHLMATGTSGKHLIFEGLLALAFFGLGALLLILSFVPQRFVSSSGRPSWRLLAMSGVPPIVLLGIAWIEDYLLEEGIEFAIPALLSLTGLLIAYGLEYRIIQLLLLAEVDDERVKSRAAILTRLLAAALILFIALKAIFAAGLGVSLWSGLAVTGLLVLAPLRLLVARLANTT